MPWSTASGLFPSSAFIVLGTLKDRNPLALVSNFTCQFPLIQLVLNMVAQSERPAKRKRTASGKAQIFDERFETATRTNEEVLGTSPYFLISYLPLIF